MSPFPGVETPGYHQASLREERHLRFAAERHLMVARPFKAGFETPGLKHQQTVVSRSDN